MGKSLVDVIRFTDIYGDDEIAAIVAESEVPNGYGSVASGGGSELESSLSAKLPHNIRAGLKDKRIGRYGIKVETSSSSPTARYANFMSILEVAGMYPGQVPVEAVIEASDITNKERIVERLRAPADETRKSAKAVSSLKKTGKFQKLSTPEGFVNVLEQPTPATLK